MNYIEHFKTVKEKEGKGASTVMILAFIFSEPIGTCALLASIVFMHVTKADIESVGWVLSIPFFLLFVSCMVIHELASRLWYRKQDEEFKQKPST